MARKKSETTEKTTIVIKPNDSLIQIKIKNMKCGQVMFTTPDSMVILKNRECWLNPNASVFPFPDAIQDRVIGIMKDVDDKFIVFARNMNIYWEQISGTVSNFLPIKEIREIAPEFIEHQIQEHETLFSAYGVDDDDEEEAW